MIWLPFKSDSGRGVQGAKLPRKAGGIVGLQAPQWWESCNFLGTGWNLVKSKIILLAGKPKGCVILCLSPSMSRGVHRCDDWQQSWWWRLWCRRVFLCQRLGSSYGLGNSNVPSFVGTSVVITLRYRVGNFWGDGRI